MEGSGGRTQTKTEARLADAEILTLTLTCGVHVSGRPKVNYTAETDRTLEIDKDKNKYYYSVLLIEMNVSRTYLKSNY